MCRQGRRRLPRIPSLKLTWALPSRPNPVAEELLREINGKALADVLDPKGPDRTGHGGEQPGDLRHGATTV